MPKRNDEELRKIAEQPNPGSASPDYGKWWRARRSLGLPTAPLGLTKNYREYLKEYMRKRRANGVY